MVLILCTRCLKTTEKFKNKGQAERNERESKLAVANRKVVTSLGHSHIRSNMRVERWGLLAGLCVCVCVCGGGNKE